MLVHGSVWCHRFNGRSSARQRGWRGRLRDGFATGLPLLRQHSDLAQLRDDLLSRMSLPCRCSPLSWKKMDHFKTGVTQAWRRCRKTVPVACAWARCPAHDEYLAKRGAPSRRSPQPYVSSLPSRSSSMAKTILHGGPLQRGQISCDRSPSGGPVGMLVHGSVCCHLCNGRPSAARLPAWRLK